MQSAQITDLRGFEVKHILEFDLPHESIELKHAYNAQQYFNAMYEFEMYLCEILRLDEPPSPFDIYERWKRILLDKGIEVYDS